jgi:Uma2 family endonuclease
MNHPHRPQSAFTTAEFNRLVRSGGFGDARVELRRGLILKMNAQHVPHANVKEQLATAIKEAIRAAGLSWNVFQEVSVEFGSSFEPLPDIVVWEPAAAPPNLDGPVPAVAVRLVVEVSDTTLADDLGEKLTDYAASGLIEYWVADVKGKILLRHKGPSANGYAERITSRFGEAFDSLAYPALRFDTKPLA